MEKFDYYERKKILHEIVDKLPPEERLLLGPTLDDILFTETELTKTKLQPMENPNVLLKYRQLKDVLRKDLSLIVNSLRNNNTDDKDRLLNLLSEFESDTGRI